MKKIGLFYYFSSFESTVYFFKSNLLENFEDIFEKKFDVLTPWLIEEVS